MSEIIVYTQNDCPPCTFVKNYLNERQIDFEERNIKNQQSIKYPRLIFI